MFSPPYHPSSNGQAERAVQTVVKKMEGPLETRLARFLFKYRVTPQAATGIAPAELLMGRRLRTHLDLLYPTVKDKVLKNQRSSTYRGSRRVRKCQYSPGDHMMCRNFMSGPTWMRPVELPTNEEDPLISIKFSAC